MPNSSKPNSLNIRMYQVGFGDCFLLTFNYAQAKKHVLIDFGTTGTPDGNDKQLLQAVAADIAQRTSRKLDAIVITHRHRDHIRGFSTDSRDGAPGKTIAQLKPDLIVQPWTEDPQVKTNAQGPASLSSAGGHQPFSRATQDFVAMLEGMHAFAQNALLREAKRLQKVRPQAAAQLRFLGEDNLKNKSAVVNLMNMAKAAKARATGEEKKFFGAEYVYHGFSSALNNLLPGVDVKVLGPPTLRQHPAIKKQKSKDDEFWMLQARFWGMQSVSSAGTTRGSTAKGLFPKARISRGSCLTQWFIERTDQARITQLLPLVRILDTAMNNTSVILLFQIGSKKFLFPGDAQIENWEFALGKDKNLLKGVTMYKVGHHGSRNATPKTLFNLMTKDGTRNKQELTSMVSTMAGKHGKTEATAVPRKTLVKALQDHSVYHTTQTLIGAGVGADDIPFSL